jgi:hypothetical protein
MLCICEMHACFEWKETLIALLFFQLLLLLLIVGCTDGWEYYVDRLLDLAHANGLTVLIDIHAIKDSQNGFDNSGQSMGFKWTTALNQEYRGDLTTFEHWPARTARWMGEFDQKTASYPSINQENIQHALDVIQIITDLYSGHPAVLGLEPVNEPWQVRSLYRTWIAIACLFHFLTTTLSLFSPGSIPPFPNSKSFIGKDT